MSNRFQIYSLKYFSNPKSSTCSAILNWGAFGKLNLENTFWPNYFYKKILYCSIHMAWSLVQEFGARRWSIGVGGFIWFLEHLQTVDKNQIKQRTNAQKFLSNHNLSWFISLGVVAWKSGCDTRVAVCETYLAVWLLMENSLFNPTDYCNLTSKTSRYTF